MAAAAQGRRVRGNPPPITQERFTIVKSAIETVNNTSTLQDDDHFTFILPGGTQVWGMFARLLVVGASTTADFKCSFSMTSSGSYEFMRQAGVAGVATGSSPTLLSTGNVTAGTDNGRFGLELVGWLTTSTNASTVKFQWAQSSATSENTSLDKGSFMDLRRLL